VATIPVAKFRSASIRSSSLVALPRPTREDLHSGSFLVSNCLPPECRDFRPPRARALQQKQA